MKPVRLEQPGEDPRDPRHSPSVFLEGGRRQGEEPNPYLAARRTWNHHLASVVSERQTWQIIGILSLLIALASVGGMIWIAKQSRFIPYVIEVDSLGQVRAAGVATTAAAADQRVVRATVGQFVADARLVTPDASLQRKAVFAIYAHLASSDPATLKMNEWLNGTADANPFKRAEREMVSVEIQSVLAQTPETWQVEWVETTRDRMGAMMAKPVTMRAVITVYLADSEDATEEELRDNPLRVYVRDFSWSPI